MKELPEAILVWIFQRDVEEYFAFMLFMNILRGVIMKYRDRQAGMRVEKAANAWLNWRN